MAGMNAMTSAHHQVVQSLLSGWRQAQEKGEQTGTAVLLSVTLDGSWISHATQPGTLYERAWQEGLSPIFWTTPGRAELRIGIGKVLELRGMGHQRFREVAEAWRSWLRRSLSVSDAGGEGWGPLFMGGFSFDPANPLQGPWQDFPDASLILPRWVYAEQDGRTRLVYQTLAERAVDPEEEAQKAAEELISFFASDAVPLSEKEEKYTPQLLETGEAEWKQKVCQVVEQIKGSGGRLNKVVMARQALVKNIHKRVAEVLEHLLRYQDNCYVFAHARQGSLFVGATPERLVEMRQGRVRVMCLAASAPRSEQPEQDQALGEELLADPKSREEHGWVVEMVRQAMAPLCEELHIPASPVLLKLKDIQHLYTPVEGRLTSGQGLLELVERLHPTPAVGGYPREEALAAIRQWEGMARGWYASPIGWLDGKGDGEFAVALRSGLWQGEEALLFAGCGIVADSNPDSEWQETRIKMQPMWRALGGV